jgi:MFS family permease
VACELETSESLLATVAYSLPLPPIQCERRGATRRDLRVSIGDGLACSLMVGVGETYLPAFALALGTGQVWAGLIASVPIFAGAILQLIAPAAICWVGSNRRWVVACVTVQALSFFPLLAAALVGHISTALLYLLAAVYWASGMASGPAWTHWIDTIIPPRIRARYMGRRSRFGQAGILAGFVGGGLALEFGESLGRPLWAFAVLFLAAAVCRFVSAGFLFAQSEPIRISGRSPTAGLRVAFGRLRTDRDGRLLIYLWGMQMAAQTAAPFYAPFMLGLLKFSYLKYMLIISAALVTKAVALPTLGMLAHRFGARRLLAAGGLAVIPLSIFWMLSQSTSYLLTVQIIAGVCWAAYELGTLLMCFEAVDRRQRIGMLTLYNVGFAAATVAGALCGGAVLALCGQSRTGYLAIFGLSAIARLMTAPLLLRIGAADQDAEDSEVEAIPHVIEMIPPFMPLEDFAASHVA